MKAPDGETYEASTLVLKDSRTMRQYTADNYAGGGLNETFEPAPALQLVEQLPAHRRLEQAVPAPCPAAVSIHQLCHPSEDQAELSIAIRHDVARGHRSRDAWVGHLHVVHRARASGLEHASGLGGRARVDLLDEGHRAGQVVVLAIGLGCDGTSNSRAGRSRRRRSQERLAEEVGIHRTYIGDVERGQRIIGLRNIDRLARALSTDLVGLMDAVEDERRR